MEQEKPELGEYAAEPEATGRDFRFEAAERRDRHDGWAADRQVAFIDALAESGCVSEACARVGMSTASAYKLRRDVKSQSFRNAWDAALDHAITRLSDAAFGRAINGVSRPVFYQGEQIGERRHYDERLTMFLLRYRDPVRFGKFRDDLAYEQNSAGPAFRLFKATYMVEDEAMMAECELLEAAEVGLDDLPDDEISGDVP